MKLRIKFLALVSVVSVVLFYGPWWKNPEVPPASSPTTQANAAPAETQKLTDQKNQGEKQESQYFAAAGWKKVDAPAPETAQVNLDESLLGTEEEKLQDQLLSASLHKENIPAARNLYLKSYDTKTRHLVAEALGRQHSNLAQTALSEILLENRFSSVAEKSFLITQLLPRSLADTSAEALLRVVTNDPDPAMQRQALVGLSGLAVQLPASQRQLLENKIPQEWLEEFRRNQDRLHHTNEKGTS